LGGSGGQGSGREGSSDGGLRSGHIHVIVRCLHVHLATAHVPVWIGESNVVTLEPRAARSISLLDIVVDDFSGDHTFVFAVNICKVADGKVDLFLATVSDVELRTLLA